MSNLDLSNFSIQSSFFIPLHDKESNENGYLAEKVLFFKIDFAMIILSKAENFNCFWI